jgi:type II secretory pathway component PulJ
MVRMRKHSGFSLLAVLVFSIIAMIIVGAVCGRAAGSFGAARVSSRSGDSYNILQSEIERARSVLRAEMFSRKDAIKYGLSAGDFINSLDDLEILKDGAPFWRVDYSERIGGKAGNVSVRIYDLCYTPPVERHAKMTQERGKSARKIDPP